MMNSDQLGVVDTRSQVGLDQQRESWWVTGPPTVFAPILGSQTELPLRSRTWYMGGMDGLS